MKHLITITGIILLFVLFFSGKFFSTGSPGAKTGSPLDGANCSECHSSAVTSQDWITTDIPQTGYVPGETYTITATGAHSGVVKFGFELTAETSGSKIGEFTITNAAETKLINSNAAVTHTSGGTTPTGDSKSWSVDWTAPVAGTGLVDFYAAFNAANGNGSTSGDAIYTSMLEIDENSAYINELKEKHVLIYPNPSNQNLTILNKEIITKIDLYDISGKKLITYTDINSKEFILDVENITPALYVIKIYTKNSQITKKIKVD